MREIEPGPVADVYIARIFNEKHPSVVIQIARAISKDLIFARAIVLTFPRAARNIT